MGQPNSSDVKMRENLCGKNLMPLNLWTYCRPNLVMLLNVVNLLNLYLGDYTPICTHGIGERNPFTICCFLHPGKTPLNLRS